MTQHLSDHDLTTAAAGLDLAETARDHLRSCLHCRARVETFAATVSARRAALEREAEARPDLSGAILARLPATPGGRRRSARHAWLALAATVLLALGVGHLVRNGHAPEVAVVPTPVAAVAVEDVLAEMEALLEDDTIPGLWVADPVSDVDELESLFRNPAS